MNALVPPPSATPAQIVYLAGLLKVRANSLKTYEDVCIEFRDPLRRAKFVDELYLVATGGNTEGALPVLVEFKLAAVETLKNFKQSVYEKSGHEIKVWLAKLLHRSFRTISGITGAAGGAGIFFQPKIGWLLVVSSATGFIGFLRGEFSAVYLEENTRAKFFVHTPDRVFETGFKCAMNAVLSQMFETERTNNMLKPLLECQKKRNAPFEIGLARILQVATKSLFYSERHGESHEYWREVKATSERTAKIPFRQIYQMRWLPKPEMV